MRTQFVVVLHDADRAFTFLFLNRNAAQKRVPTRLVLDAAPLFERRLVHIDMPIVNTAVIGAATTEAVEVLEGV